MWTTTTLNKTISGDIMIRAIMMIREKKKKRTHIYENKKRIQGSNVVR